MTTQKFELLSDAVNEFEDIVNNNEIMYDKVQKTGSNNEDGFFTFPDVIADAIGLKKRSRAYSFNASGLFVKIRTAGKMFAIDTNTA